MLRGSGHLCAGAAARLPAVLDPKLDQIGAAGIDYVVAVNPGCLRQLRQELRRRKSKVRTLHIADLLRLAARDR